jgi:hypothetical protein
MLVAGFLETGTGFGERVLFGLETGNWKLA